MLSILDQFLGEKALPNHIGIELEAFICDAGGMPTPRSPEFLMKLYSANKDRLPDLPLDDFRQCAWSKELSACQVEYRTRPRTDLRKLSEELRDGIEIGMETAKWIGGSLQFKPVGSIHMPTDVYPYDSRYQEIIEVTPIQMLQAGCRVASTQISIGVENIDHGLEVYNALAEKYEDLLAMGDLSGGRRMDLYREMAGDCVPFPIQDQVHLVEESHMRGFGHRLQDWWSLIRLARHRRVEVRVFDSTDDVDLIMSWVERIQQIIR